MPEYLLPAGLIAVGLFVLLAGGEVLVRGASGLAAAIRVSPLVIGLTVVAFGTSAPELAVAVQSSYADKPDLAIGNVVGSCIFNVLFILGATAIIRPVIVSARLVRLEVPLLIVASAVLLLLGLDECLSRVDGLLLFGGLICYVTWTIVQSRRESKQFRGGFEEVVETRAAGIRGTATWNVAVQLVLVVAGLGLLTLGSKWLVDGAVKIAGLLGVGELIIGLTIVAIGTGLPEVATSIVASVRGHGDIAVGNIVGSNIFNILCVLGLSSMVAPSGIAVSPEALWHDIPVLIAVGVACLPIFFTDYRIHRWEGYLFFGYYLAYMAYLILAETKPEVAREFGMVMVLFVVPLTAITLLIGVVRKLPDRVRQNPLLAWLGGKPAPPPRSEGEDGSPAGKGAAPEGATEQIEPPGDEPP